jgi:hypothetical protein
VSSESSGVKEKYNFFLNKKKKNGILYLKSVKKEKEILKNMLELYKIILYIL